MRLSFLKPSYFLRQLGLIDRIVQTVDAVSLGPIVLSTERFSALLGFMTFVVIAELLARRKSERLSAWASNTVLVSLLGARVGFVLGHLSDYATDPLSIFYIWQGGFSALSALAAGLAYTLWTFRRERLLLLMAARPVLAALMVWLSVSALGATPSGGATSFPELELETLTSTTVDLSSFKGQPTILNLWATWCGPCKREMPLLADVAAERPDVAFVFVDLRENPELVMNYLQSQNLSLDNVLIDRRGEVAQAFRARGTPTSLFFNAKGELLERHLGELSRAALNDYLTQIGP